jgi:putative ABC transport system permease protein
MFPDGTLAATSAAGPSVKPVLQLKGVSKTYRRGDEQVHVLVDFDFTLDAGEFVVVTGPSGAGKSTLLHIAGGLDAPDSGTVAVTGQDVWSMSTGARAAFRRRNLGFVFQFFNLVPMLTAVENVSLPLVLDGMPARSADARAEELLQRVGLGERARHRPAELSGGQMQRVAVARALVARPSIILADEPTGNLESLFDRGFGSAAVAVRRRRRGGRPGDTRPGRGAVRHARAAPCRRARVRNRPRRAHRGAMKPKLCAAWLSFRRIHLAALIADWRRTLLSVIGVALGVTVVLGMLIVKFELVRPFDAFGPSLTHAAETGVIEITPNVSGRLPFETVNRLRAEVAGAEAVIPIVAALTPMEFAGGTHGFFLLGGSCQIELLVGPFNCEQRTREQPADGPGVPLQIPTVIAHRHGLQLGAELHIPGLPPGSAHLGWTFPEFDRVESINDGYVLIAPSGDIAASMLSTPGYATAAFVLPKKGTEQSRVASDIQRVIESIATAGPPRRHLPAIFEGATQNLNLSALAGIIIGVLIAVNTILLAVEDRRAVMGTIGAIGAKPIRLLGGMLGEGAAVGLLGGLLGVPSGFLFGKYLLDRFGRSMLAGSGGTVTAHFTPNLIGMGAAAGTVCGIIAMIGPATRLLRDGPLESMASVGGVQRERKIPVWPLLVGVVLLACAVVLMKIFERGSLPPRVGINGLTVALCGVVLVTVWFAPRGARVLIELLTFARPGVGRLLGADARRYALLFAFSAALLAESASLAIGSYSMQLLSAEQVAEQKSDRLPAALLISAQSVFDQRDGRLSDATFELVAGAAHGRSVSSRWQSTISSGALSRLVIGVTPGDRYSQALYEPTDERDRFWQGLRDGEIGLSEIAASRLRVANGDTVELPTVDGPKQYRVAGIVRPQMVNDASVGDFVLISEGLARSDWAAVRNQVAVAYPSAADATAHRDDFLNLAAGLWVYDNEQWRTVGSAGITRFLEPLTIAGYVVMAAAGLSLLNVYVLGLVQRRRERAALRAIGATPGQEQAVIVVNAGLLGLLVSGVAVLGGVGLTYLWSLSSPVFYGFKIDWGVVPLALRTGVTAVFAFVLAAAVYPVIHARRLETVEVLRTS